MRVCVFDRTTMEGVVKKLGRLAEKISEILGQSLGIKSSYFKERCEKGKSSFRLNRYPPCPFASKVYGLIPHTDSDYLTILYQPQISGLQLLKAGKWFPVKPNPQALLVNIGDLFQVPTQTLFKFFSSSFWVLDDAPIYPKQKAFKMFEKFTNMLIYLTNKYIFGFSVYW